MTKANNCVLGLHSLCTKTYHGIEWDDDNDAAKPTFECHWANNQSRVFAKIGCSQLLQGHNDGKKCLAFRPLICVKKQLKHHKSLKECTNNITGPFRDIRHLEPWLGH